MPGPAEALRLIVDLHRRQVAGVVEVQGGGKIAALYRKSRDELEEKVRRHVRAGRGATFGAHQARQVLVQVNVAIADIEAKIGTTLRDVGPAAAALAPRHVRDAAVRLAPHFSGSTPVVQARQASVFLGNVPAGLTPSLLDKYRSSQRLYGGPVIRAVKDQLALSVVQNEGVDEAVARVVGSGGIFAGAKWRAERIVRTELAYTYGVGKQEGLVDLAKEVPRLLKRLVATHDDRTGEDSEQLDGQTVPVDEPFVWEVRNSKGRKTGEVIRYLQPPNRPNDREITIPWQSGWPARATE